MTGAESYQKVIIYSLFMEQMVHGIPGQGIGMKKKYLLTKRKHRANTLHQLLAVFMNMTGNGPFSQN